MFFRVVKRKHADNHYDYLCLVESYRDDGEPRQRLLHSFGNIAHIPDGKRRELVRSLQRALGIQETPDPHLTALDTLHFGDVLVLRSLWEELKLPDTIRRLTADRKVDFDVELLAFLMAAHRLIDPGSKLSLTRWLPKAYLQGYDLEAIGVQHFYRTLDILNDIARDIARDIEEAVFLDLCDLFDRRLSVVFYDLTSTYFEGDGPAHAAYGYSRDRRPDQKQIVIALAVDDRGLPITHLVFPGNCADQKTLDAAVEDLKHRFEITRTIFVADGGVMCDANIETLTTSGYQHLIALPKIRARARRLAAGIEWTIDDAIGENVMARAVTSPDAPGIKYLVCHNPERAEQEAQIRDERIRKAIKALTDLQRQVAEGQLRDHHKIIAAASARLVKLRTKRYFKIDCPGDGQFGFHLREDKIAKQAALDGYYFLQTDATDLDASQVLEAYKTLQRVERAFRDLKDTIKLRPIHHYDDARVRGHVFVCMLSYLLGRMLELRLEDAGHPLSVTRAMEALEPVRVVRNELDGRLLHCVVQRRPPQTNAILKALGLTPLPVVLDG
jgi:transposase